MTEQHEMPGVRRSRLALDALVRLRQGEREWPPVRVHDASLSGMRIARPDGFDLDRDSRVQVRIESRGRQVPEAMAQVVRVGLDDVALAFDGLGLSAESELGWMLERFGELHDGAGTL